LVILALVIIAFFDISVASQSSGTAISATRLEEKPDAYFIIKDPVSYFLKAIANEGEPVFLGLFDYTNIDELIKIHNTNNVSYLGEFFVVYRFSIDAFSFGPFLLQAIIIGAVLVIIYWFISRTQKPELHFLSKFLIRKTSLLFPKRHIFLLRQILLWFLQDSWLNCLLV
jgi:hypothetical protein